MSIKFKNREHEKFYEQCLARTGGLDPYHKAFFYTMGISDETRKHVEDVFDFQEDVIRPEGMNKGWQTSGSSCLTRLASNLWNGWNADGCATPYPQWLAEQENHPTWKAAIQQDIDQVVNEVLTWNQFVRALEGKGYILRLNRKYITLQPPGKARPVRFKTLGKNYTPEAIRRRILYPERNSPAGSERPLPPALRTFLSERPARKVTGLQKLYVIYLFQVGVLPTKPVYMSYAVREDIRKLDQRIAQVEFILKNEIQDRGQLNEMRCAAEGKIDRLLKERRGLYRRDPDSPRIQEITARLKEIRRTAKLCRDIEEHSLAIEQRLEEARKEREQREAMERETRSKQEQKENKKEISK